MAQYQKLNVGIVTHEGVDAVTNAQVRVSKNATRALVQAEVDDGLNNPPLGSLILINDGSDGRAYLRVAEAGAATDFEKITTTAAD